MTDLAYKISKGKIYIRVGSFTGDVYLDGWSDAFPGNPFWTNVHLAGRPNTAVASYATDWAQALYNGSARKSGDVVGNTLVFQGGSQEIDGKYKKMLDDMLSILESPLSQQDMHAINLANVAVTGANNFHVKVTPVSTNWSVDVQFYTIRSDGQIDILTETALDQSKTSSPSPEMPRVKIFLD